MFLPRKGFHGEFLKGFLKSFMASMEGHYNPCVQASFQERIHGLRIDMSSQWLAGGVVEEGALGISD